MFIINDNIINVDFVGLRYERIQQYLNNLSNTCADHASRLGTQRGLTHGGFLAIFSKDFITGKTAQIGVVKVNGIRPKNGITTPTPPEEEINTTYAKGLFVQTQDSSIKKGVRIGERVIFASYENAGDPVHLVDVFLAEILSSANEVVTAQVA